MPKSRTILTESDLTPSPDPQPVAEPTIAALRAAATAASADHCIREAQDELRPLAAAVRQHLPTADRLAQEAEAPVAAARQDLKDGADLLTQEFRDHVQDRINFADRIIQAPKDGRRGLDLFATLTVDQCKREEWQRQINQASPEAWPGRVNTVRRLLAGGASITEETAQTYLRQLKEVHERLQGNVRGELIRRGATPPIMSRESPRSEPLKTEMGFSAWTGKPK